MPVTLVLVRHGEMPLNREENYDKIIKDHFDGPLSERGIAEAQSVGRHLALEQFTRVYVSEFIRTQQTAQHILKQSKHCSSLEVIVDKRISERDPGTWREKTPMDMIKAAMAAGMYPHFIPCEGGETVEQVMERAASFLKEFCELADQGSEEDIHHNILVATHGAWLASFMEHLLTSPNLYKLENCNEKLAKAPAPTTGVTKILVGKRSSDNQRTINFLTLYDNSHLNGIELPN